jgi:fructose-1,6-bisphosphatase II
VDRPALDRNLALELLRVTEWAALAAAPLQARGNKEAADQRAVDAMRWALTTVDMRGTVVIGEGEKDEAPMLYFGEELGNGLAPEVDIAVDPIDGTEFTANGLPGGMSVVALAERHSLFTTHVHYMDKLVVGRRARGVIDIGMSVEWNLIRIANAENMHPEELTVMVLDRERNQDVIAQVRDVGARVILIPGGDVSAAILAASEHIPDKHVLIGSGGATEGVLAACAVKCLHGGMQARLLLRTPQEQALAATEGTRNRASLGIEDLCGGSNVFFAATGITTGELLRGVRYDESYAYTQSLVMRSATHTVRFDDAWHDVAKLRSKGLLPEQVVPRRGRTSLPR